MPLTRREHRLIIDIAYFGGWIALAALTWMFFHAALDIELSAALIATLFILPMMLFSGYRGDLADHLLCRCREIDDSLWLLESSDLEAIPGEIRWNTANEEGPDGFGWQSYVLDQQWVLINPGLYDLAGFLTHTDFTRCIELTYPAACVGCKIGDMQQMLIKRLSRWARSDDAVVFAGSVIDLDAGNGRAYLYYTPKNSRAVARKAARLLAQSCFEPEVRDCSDPEWNNYLQSLIPNEGTLRRMYNQRRSTDWRCRGIDIEKAHNVYFFVEMTASGRCPLSSGELAEHGCQVYQRAAASGTQSCLVLSGSTELSLAALESVTSSLASLLEKHNGRINGYELDSSFVDAIIPSAIQPVS